MFTTVFFLFPPDLPVTGNNMNYAIVVFGVVCIISMVTWIVEGRKNFIGPRDLHVLLDLAKAGQAEQVQQVLAQEAEKRR